MNQNNIHIKCLHVSVPLYLESQIYLVCDEATK
jgi:hypothetical protein